MRGRSDDLQQLEHRESPVLGSIDTPRQLRIPKQLRSRKSKSCGGVAKPRAMSACRSEERGRSGRYQASKRGQAWPKWAAPKGCPRVTEAERNRGNRGGWHRNHVGPPAAEPPRYARGTSNTVIKITSITVIALTVLPVGMGVEAQGHPLAGGQPPGVISAVPTVRRAQSSDRCCSDLSSQRRPLGPADKVPELALRHCLDMVEVDGYVVDFPYREYSAPWFGYAGFRTRAP